MVRHKTDFSLVYSSSLSPYLLSVSKSIPHIAKVHVTKGRTVYVYRLWYREERRREGERLEIHRTRDWRLLRGLLPPADMQQFIREEPT